MSHESGLKSWETRKKYRYLKGDDESGRNELLKLGYKFVRITKKGSHMFVLGGTEPPTDEEEAEALETTFGLERDLQAALHSNIAQLEHGMKVIGKDKERHVTSGFIDITAEDKDGNPVVIELKAGTADRETIGQILGYMGDLQSESDKPVRGIIVASDFASAAVSALGALTNLQLRKYRFSFTFEPVTKHPKAKTHSAGQSPEQP